MCIQSVFIHTAFLYIAKLSCLVEFQSDWVLGDGVECCWLWAGHVWQFIAGESVGWLEKYNIECSDNQVLDKEIFSNTYYYASKSDDRISLKFAKQLNETCIFSKILDRGYMCATNCFRMSYRQPLCVMYQFLPQGYRFCLISLLNTIFTACYYFHAHSKYSEIAPIQTR